MERELLMGDSKPSKTSKKKQRQRGKRPEDTPANKLSFVYGADKDSNGNNFGDAMAHVKRTKPRGEQTTSEDEAKITSNDATKTNSKEENEKKSNKRRKPKTKKNKKENNPFEDCNEVSGEGKVR